MMKVFEMLLWFVGTTLLALYFGAGYWAEHARRDGVAAFADADARETHVAKLPGASQGAGANSDTATDAAKDAVIAVLRIPGIELEVPVYQGTTEHVLRRGAGLVEGTAFPGSMGNIGIAAHRDSHFRGLQHLAVGDRVELGTPGQTRVYRVTTLEVVGPGDVHVLDDTGEPVLTLVTCYPFYFVGNAPQRFIVRATATDGST